MVMMVVVGMVVRFVAIAGQQRLLAQPKQLGPEDCVAPVGDKGQDEEDGRANIGPSDDAGHGFRVHRMRGKEATGDSCGEPGPGWQERTGQQSEEGRCGAMEQHVDEMISGRLQFVNPMIEPEGENAQRSVGLVRSGMGQRGAPKVVVHDVDPWRRRVDVWIGLYRPTGSKEKKKKKMSDE